VRTAKPITLVFLKRRHDVHESVYPMVCDVVDNVLNSLGVLEENLPTQPNANNLNRARRELVEARDDAKTALEFLALCRGQDRGPGSDASRPINEARKTAQIEANGACELYVSAFQRAEDLEAKVAELEDVEGGKS
jgi:hypothetical protein